ncbi:MAG: DNA polymerase III subunit beta [Chlamydiota bacterium]
MTSMNPVIERTFSTAAAEALKVIINRTELLELIGKIQGVIPSKPSTPILSHVLIEAKGDHLILSASDSMVSVKTLVTAQVIQEGKVVLPAKKFFSLIRELTSPQIQIEVLSSTIYVRAGTSIFKLHGIQPEEFPALPEYTQAHFINLHAPTLKELFTRTSFAVAREDSRHLLNGVFLQLTQNMLTLIGTDGKKLAKITAELDMQELQGGFIVPLKAIDEMVQALDKDATAKLYLAQDKIALETSSTTVISKLLMGEYPDVNRVIPQKTSATMHLHREELVTLLRQIALFTSELNHSVRFTFREGELELSAAHGEVGEGKVSMPVDYSGDLLEIAFNPHFFIDILKHCQDTTVNFGITDSFNPGVITDQTTALFVIMPMRLPSNTCS